MISHVRTPDRAPDDVCELDDFCVEPRGHAPATECVSPFPPPGERQVPEPIVRTIAAPPQPAPLDASSVEQASLFEAA